MSFGLLNAAMLFGLAALALPVVVHLISKRKFDIVHWGAMQFLELGRRTRRRIRIEELLLMLLRMAMLGLLVFALARPWAQGGLFASFGAGTSRDLVVIMDGSYSMGWEGRAQTPHAAAIQWAHELLEATRGGDTVTLLDAREQVRNVTQSPTTDVRSVREQLDKLPEPSGTSHLSEAAAEALKVLSSTSNLSRQVVILTDGQSLPWEDGDDAWSRFDDLRAQPAVQPRVFVVDVTGGQSQADNNFSVDALELSRELSVPEFPIRVRTVVRQSGGVSTRRRVSFEVNGQRLEEKTVSLTVPPNGKVPVEFEHRFPAVGSYVISVVLDADNLPGDNRADAAVIVENGVPVLLVDGDPQLDPVKSETFFLKAALSASGNETPWVVATVVDWESFGAESLQDQSVAVFCNVPRLTDAQRGALADFVGRGGGLIIAPGDKVDAAAWNALVSGGLVPHVMAEIDREENYTLRPVHVAADSLEVPWVSRFRPEHGIDFVQARLSRWWKLEAAPADPAAAGPPAGENAAASGAEPGEIKIGEPLVHAKVATGNPLIVSRDYGAGMVLQLAVPLDADWTTLPSKNDFVPFVHEMVFLLAGRTAGRNVDVGMPLQLPVAGGQTPESWTFQGPDGSRTPAVAAGDELRPLAQLPSAPLPGVYRALCDAEPDRSQYFVVNFDRSESDLAPLEEADRQRLTADGRMQFVNTVEEFETATLTDASRTEMWWWLMLAILAMLVFEVVMTRRLVQGGHEALDLNDGESRGRTGREVVAAAE